MPAATTAVPAWSVVTVDAVRHRERLLEQLRQWGAGMHVARRALPSRWYAAHDIAARPYRSRLASIDGGATDRDRGEAAAVDLWDAVSTAWALVRWLATARMDNAPGVEHIVAELHAAGRWLARYPVSVAAHDEAIDRLFVVDAETTP